MRNPNYQEGEPLRVAQAESGGAKKVTGKIFHSIETQLLMDARLTNYKIQKITMERFSVTLGGSTVGTERRNLGFHLRAIVEQNLTWQQRRARRQFSHDLLIIGVDMKTIILLDESLFNLWSDKHWKHTRRGCWNSTSFARRVKSPKSLMIWGAIQNGFQSVFQFCSHGPDADKCQARIVRPHMIEQLDRK
jgi:hypothetical protein